MRLYNLQRTLRYYKLTIISIILRSYIKLAEKPDKADNDKPDPETKPPPEPQPHLTQVSELETDPKILLQRIDSMEKTIQELKNENTEKDKAIVLAKIKKIRPALAEKHKDASYKDLARTLEILEDVGAPPEFPVLGLRTETEPEEKPKLFYNRITGEYE